MIFGEEELAEHVAVRLAAVLEEACFQRDPTLIYSRQAAKDLIRAVQARGNIDLTDLVQGALVDYSKHVRDELKKTGEKLEAMAVRAACQRVAAACTAAAEKAYETESKRYVSFTTSHPTK